jgi:hypothetical protein
MNLRPSVTSALAAMLWLAACGTAGTGPDAANADSREANRIEYPTVEAALSAVRARPGIIESQSDGWTVLEDKARRETWLFSPPGHPAHPAVVKRTVVRRVDDTNTRTTALCGGGQAECDRLIADFLAADKKAAEQARQTGQLPGAADRPRMPGSRY